MLYSNVTSVPDIPSPYSPSFDGPAALTSLDGKGAFLQHGENFFELTCDASSCTWSVMDQTLDVGRFGSVMTYLPSGFECNQGNLLKNINNKTILTPVQCYLGHRELEQREPKLMVPRFI